MKKMIVAMCMALTLTMMTVYAESDEPVHEDVQAAAEYNGTIIEVLDYGFTEHFRAYKDDSGEQACCVSFYFSNDNASPAYLLESYGVTAYQDGIELDNISLNSDFNIYADVTRSVKDGAGIECVMAFATISDSPVELWITEPTAEADQLIQLTFDYSLDKVLKLNLNEDEADNSETVTVYEDDNISMVYTGINVDGVHFKIANNTADTIWLIFDNIAVDGVSFNLGDGYYESTSVATNSTCKFIQFINDEYDLEPSTLGGTFRYASESGDTEDHECEFSNVSIVSEQ